MAAGPALSPTQRSGSYAVPENHSLLSLMSTVHTVEVPQGSHSCLISALNPARMRWDLFILALAVWSCFYVPFSVAFLSEMSILPLKVLDLFIDAAYIADVFVFARSSYIDLTTGEEVTDSSRILLNYATSGKLIVDVVSAVPFDVITWLTNDYKEMQLVTISKIIRLFRLMRLSKILMFAQTKASVKLSLKLCQLMFLFITYLHTQACLWYLITQGPAVYIPPGLYVDHKTDLYSSSIWRQYAYSLYMSVYMFTAAEIGPRTLGERIFTGYALLSGQLFQGYMFGEIAVVLFDLNRKTLRLSAIQGAMTTTMANIELSTALQRKIVMFFTSMLNSITLQMEYEEFFAIIPPSLQQEVRAVVFETVLLHNNVLKGHMRMSAAILHRVTQRFCQPELIVVSQGEAGNDLFFISKGTCVVSVMDEHKIPHRVKYLKEGSLFGEVSLVFPTVRTASVQTTDNCTLAVLSRSDFNDIANRYPRLKKLMKNSALRYQDNWKLFQLDTLKQCPYFSSLPEKILGEICYSLPVKVYDSGMTVCEAGTEANHMLFMLEGLVEITLTVNDVRMKMQPKTQTLPSMEQFVLANRRFSAAESKPVTGQNRVKLTLDELGPGSAFCSNIILTGDLVKFTAKAKKLSVFMVITKEKLEELMQRIEKLHTAVITHRSILLVRSNFSQLKRAQYSCLDYQKRVLAKRNKTFWNSAMKVKRCIISKLMEKRAFRAKGFRDIWTMSNKLKALQEAEESNDVFLVEKLRRGVAPEGHYLLAAYKMLDMREVENPLLTQFAMETAKVVSAVRAAKEKIMRLERQQAAVRRTVSQTRRVLQEIGRMMELVTEIKK